MGSEDNDENSSLMIIVGFDGVKRFPVFIDAVQVVPVKFKDGGRHVIGMFEAAVK